VKRTDWLKSAIRTVFGVIWLIDAHFKWLPAFQSGYLAMLQDAAKGQPAGLSPWFNFWINLVSPRVTFFSVATAVIETGIGMALILGFARKLTYLAAAGFSLVIWSTAEGFGGPYSAGSTDIGSGVVYALVFLALLALNRQAGPSRYSVDRWIEARVSWWKRVAEARQPLLAR